MLYIVDLEAVDTRYTEQWKNHLPTLFKDAIIISGPTDIPNATTPGAFLNFGGTNIYKAEQVSKIARLFVEGKIQSGDKFLFTDAWHPGIINLKYMSELLNIPVEIHGLWHAGSYDPADFLGRLIGDVPWVRHAEKSFYHCIDYNWFATDFHLEMFKTNLGVSSERCYRTGWPMEYMKDILEPFRYLPKKDLILFPHRIAPEKQVDIFKDLKESLPEYEFVICQETRLTKREYHILLGQAKIVFSANLQETLGISCYEGAIVGAIPMVPDRLSYKEMYNEIFKYPAEWTESMNKYKCYKHLVIDRIHQYMKDHQYLTLAIETQTKNLDKFFVATDLKKGLNEDLQEKGGILYT